MKIIYETFIPKVNYQVLQTNISVSRKHQKVHTGCNAYISNLIECMKDIYKKIVEKERRKKRSRGTFFILISISEGYLKLLRDLSILFDIFFYKTFSKFVLELEYFVKLIYIPEFYRNFTKFL